MSARALPIAARLSRKQLRLMRLALPSGDTWIDLSTWRRTAERLSPQFLKVRRIGRGLYGQTTDEGRAVLAARSAR